MNKNNRVNRISCVTQKDGSIDITVPASMAEHFRTMVVKGTNLSPNMHVEIRDFADRLAGLDTVIMKQEIYGYPKYPAPKDIVSAHWDIPSEDKFELAASPCLGHPETCNCPKHCR